MPDRCTYDYAIVRVVPRVERGEFVNVGAIVSSDAKGYLAARFAVDEARLLALDPHVDLNAVRTALAAIAAVCAGGAPAGADRHALAARALPLAGRAAQHDHPDLGRPHRPLRRPRRRARSSARADGAAADAFRALAMNAASTPPPTAVAVGADLPFRSIAELDPRACAARRRASPALVDSTAARSTTASLDALMDRVARVACSATASRPASRSRSAPSTRRATQRSSSARCAPASSSRRSLHRSRRRAFARCSPTPARACSSSTPAPTRARRRRRRRPAAPHLARRQGARHRLRRLARRRGQRAARRRDPPRDGVQHHLFVGDDRHAEGHRPAARHALDARDARRPLRLLARDRRRCWRRRSTRTRRWSSSSRPSPSAAPSC